MSAGASSLVPIIHDPVSKVLWQHIVTVAPSSLPVLVLGETGSGKEVAAEEIHRRSSCASGPLLRVNCAGLSEELVDSELFGHERGAFTGALTAREGLFEAADGGTLFLDEVGELSARTQAKLLRVLESGELIRVGSTRSRCVNVRVVSATHRDLPRMVAEGGFREDLYFRLSGVSLYIPPLRERKADILPLAERFVVCIAKRLERLPPMLSERAEAWLLTRRWPGNVRQLRHVLERAVVMCAGPIIEPELLDVMEAHSSAPLVAAPSVVDCEDDRVSAKGIRAQVRTFERARIVATLAATHGNQTRAAERLGISRRTLTNKLTEHGIERPRKRVG